jgi:hypothetical protein
VETDGVQVPVESPGRAAAVVAEVRGAVEMLGRKAAVVGEMRGAVEIVGTAVEIEGFQVPVDRSGMAAAVVGAVRGAVETTGSPVVAEVDVAGGGAAEVVPDEDVWAEAEEESTAAARMPIMSVFTGCLSILNRFPSGRNGTGGGLLPYIDLLTEVLIVGAVKLKSDAAAPVPWKSDTPRTG